MNKSLFITIFLSVTTLPIILKIFLRKYYKKREENFLKKLKNVEENCYFQCVFINYKNFKCRKHLFGYQECGEECSYFYLKRIIGFIGSAQKTINMCMYLMTLKQVSEELAKASQRGVKVQMITDKMMTKIDPSIKNQTRQGKSGVQQKTQKNHDTMMHHKFCLIDEKDPQLAKMFFGSLNLTTQALCKNFEAVIFTNNTEVIRRFSEEFEKLWRDFEYCK